MPQGRIWFCAVWAPDVHQLCWPEVTRHLQLSLIRSFVLLEVAQQTTRLLWDESSAGFMMACLSLRWGEVLGRFGIFNIFKWLIFLSFILGHLSQNSQKIAIVLPLFVSPVLCPFLSHVLLGNQLEDTEFEEASPFQLSCWLQVI